MAANQQSTAELQLLQKKVGRWAKKNPQLVRKALNWGAVKLKLEVLKNMRSKLTRRSGKLFRSIEKKVIIEPARGTVDASVFVSKSAGNMQALKARVHEHGASFTNPGGQPFMFINGRPQFPRRDSPIGKQMISAGMVTKPHHVTIPKRASFLPAQKKWRKPIVRKVLHEIMEGFRREH